MKKVRFAGGGQARGDGTGNAQVTVPSDSRLTHVRIIPGLNVELGTRGTWWRINESAPQYAVVPLILCSDTFGNDMYCCLDGVIVYNWCDLYPGEGAITIVIGDDARPDDDTPDVTLAPGSPADEWLVVYTGGG